MLQTYEISRAAKQDQGRSEATACRLAELVPHIAKQCREPEGKQGAALALAYGSRRFPKQAEKTAAAGRSKGGKGFVAPKLTNTFFLTLS